MRREGERGRDRLGGRGLAWLVKSLVFTLKAKRSPERFQGKERHFRFGILRPSFWVTNQMP